MILFLTAAFGATADFDTLDSALQRCSRDDIGPVFAAEAGRRSHFMSEAYKEQASIVAERLDIAARRRALREAGKAEVRVGDNDGQLTLLSQAIEDRQKALNDRRMLEALRTDAMDTKRRYYLAHCANGKAHADD